MDHLITTVAKVAQTSVRNDDDLIDRLNHRYTVVFLVVFTVIVSTTQYVGAPIHCWCPAYFTENHQQFTNKICWISNTYYLPERVVAGQPGAIKRHISYYQWVPVMLLLQALLFHLPCLFWRIFSDRSGINVNNLVEAAETIQNALYPERREKTIRYMIRHLDHYLDYQRDYRGGCCDGIKQCMARTLNCTPCGNRRGNYLVGLYMFTKVLYLANVILQLYLLDKFIGDDYHLYGVQAVIELAQGMGDTGQRTTKRFPRVTLCDFEIRQMGNFHRHTVQCVLPINFFRCVCV